MNEKDKQVIITEINKWRQSKLLPAEYCDFLLNLYSAGTTSTTGQNKAQQGGTGKKISMKLIALVLAVIAGISAIIYLAIHFSTFPIVTQVLLLVVFVLALYIATFMYRSRGQQSVILLLLHNMASVSLAISAFYLHSLLIGQGHQTSLLQFFLFVFVIWSLMSVWLQHILIFAAGIAGISMIFYQIVNLTVIDVYVLTYQLYWIPLFMVAIWTSYAMYQHTPLFKYCLVMFLASIVYLVMPEISYYVSTMSISELIYLVPVKLLVMFVYIYSVNKNIRNTNKTTALEV